MKRDFVLITAITVGLGMAGCARVTTQVVEKPRVDQQLQGNRGYLVGSAPKEGPRKATRKILEADVELPTRAELNPWRVKKPAAETGKPQAAAQISPSQVPAVSQRPVPVEGDLDESVASIPSPVPAEPIRHEVTPSTRTYTVIAGDTLDKISGKVYGDSSQWRRIYEANQGKLKSPNKIYPGQKLVIPPARSERKSRYGMNDDLK